jgi:copper homeostasis protein
MRSRVLFEACVDSAAAALAAQEGGAGRIELCGDLSVGGITPSVGDMQRARQGLTIPLHVMIRPRGGDFCYSDAEFAAMQQDLARARKCGVHGVVFGLLTPDRTVDAARTAALIRLARPMNVTFHRAFDEVTDSRQSLETLIRLGVPRVLTSGLAPTAWDGVERLADLVRQAGDRIVVMPGCGVTAQNVAAILARTGAKEVHGTARSAAFPATTPDRIRAVVQAIDGWTSHAPPK